MLHTSLLKLEKFRAGIEDNYKSEHKCFLEAPPSEAWMNASFKQKQNSSRLNNIELRLEKHKTKERKSVRFGDIELCWYNKFGMVKDQARLPKKLKTSQELKEEIILKKIDELKQKRMELYQFIEDNGDDWGIMQEIHYYEQEILFWQQQQRRINPSMEGFESYTLECEDGGEEPFFMSEYEIAENEKCFEEFFDGFGTSGDNTPFVH